jgi:uncharacterized membrane protein
MKIKDITLVAILTALIFILEQALSLVPFVQLTIFLLVLYSKKLGILKTLIIIIVHVFLDNLVSGYFNVLFVIFMIIGYSFIPVIINTVSKKTENPIKLGLIGILSSFVYSWIMLFPSCIVFEMNFIDCFIGDITFEIGLVVSSFISILFLYRPMEKVFNKVY